jgi:hypothetical protein
MFGSGLGLFRLYQTEVAISPVVEDRLSSAVCVEEEEEVVSEHLHLQSSFLDRHRTHLEGLLPHDAGRSVCYLIDR